MSGQEIYNNNFPVDQGNNSWNDPDDILSTKEDAALFKTISTYFMGQLDIEDVKRDPAYAKTDEMAKMMISGYKNSNEHSRDSEKFIRSSFAADINEEKIKDEINEIKQEISNSDLDKISDGWIKEWQEKKRITRGRDPKTEEIRKYITDSLESPECKAGINTSPQKRKSAVRRIIASYVLPAAAAITGAVFLIRSILPSYNPDKIFNRYYEPLYTVSTVTRGLNNNGSDNFTSALESYRDGNYEAAASGFSKSLQEETASLTPGFFLGITQIALENYDQAVRLLEGVTDQKSELTKDARWYLGLAYIKTGNKMKASECFELLAQSPGFYSERSEKILRRLK